MTWPLTSSTTRYPGRHRARGIVVNKPSVVAIEKSTHRVLAVGHEAKNMINHTPDAFSAEHPLHDGVVTHDHDVTEGNPARSSTRPRISTVATKPRIVICIPCGATSVEKSAPCSKRPCRRVRAKHTCPEEPGPLP